MAGVMDWSRLQHEIPFEKNFRWRGGVVSRIEGLTDAVFAVSVTLLVVSTEVPTSYAQLIDTMKAFPAFALSFALLLMVWYFHFIHFRRYGLEDVTTMFLNIALLFVVLMYVYPLKFMVGFLVEWASNGMGAALRSFELGPVTVGHLLAIYGIGFVAMYVILALMAAHALRLRDKLELNDVEVVMTRALINTHCIQVAVGSLSVVLALALPSPYQGMAGFAYTALPIVHPLHGYFADRGEKAALAGMQAAEAAGENGASPTAPRRDAAAASEDTPAAP
jgi:uncharacterized membrane protein